MRGFPYPAAAKVVIILHFQHLANQATLLFFYIIPTNLQPNSQPLPATISKPNAMNTTDSPPIALLIVNPHSGPNHKRSFQWLLYTNTRRILRNAGYEAVS